MRGKKARGRSNRSEGGAAAAQPSPAVPSILHDPPGLDPRTHQPENSQEATTAPTHFCSHDSEQANRAQLTEKLREFAESTEVGIELANDQLVDNTFLGDVVTIAAAAERGDTQAQLYMVCRSYDNRSLDERNKWAGMAYEQGNMVVILWMGLCHVNTYIAHEKKCHDCDMLKNIALKHLWEPADHGSATAQYTLGMLLYCSQCESGAKADLLDAARWIRKAAMQGFMDPQYELGEMFRHGVFCDHIYMRFARKYIRRASVQGHVEAISRIKELRSCVMCGADDAKLACSLCHRARYCDSRCSEKHWCEGGGVGVGLSGGAGTRHKDTCPRTHAR